MRPLTDPLAAPLIGPVRDRFQRAVTGHRALAVAIGTAALFGCAVTYALPRQAGPLSSARVMIASLTYTVFAVTVIARWPSWLLVAAAAAGAWASMAAGVPDGLINSVLVVAALVFSLRSELGAGIIGMRERAAAAGGWVSAGPRDGGGFQVQAELPLQAGPA